MKKVKNHKKQWISIFLILTVSLTVFFGVQSGWANTEMPTYNQYKADYYLNYSGYSFFMSDQYTSPYRSVVETNENSAVYKALITSWEVSTFEASDITKYSKQRVGYYESFLFDILYSGQEKTKYADSANKVFKATQASMLKKVTEYSNAMYTKATNIAQMNTEQLEQLGKALEQCKELEQLFKVLGNISKVTKYASTVEDLVQKLAKLQTISELGLEYSVVLDNVADQTGDVSMKAACTEMSEICDGCMSEEELIAYMAGDQALDEMFDKVMGKIWTQVLDKITGSYGLAVEAGQKVGKWASELIFSTDSTIETYSEMKALYDFENALKASVKKYAASYKSSNTDYNARLFNASYDMMLKTFGLGCDISTKWIEDGYEKGMANMFFCNVMGKADEYAKYKKSLENIKSDIDFIYTYANGDLYEAYKDTYCVDVSASIGMDQYSDQDLESKKVTEEFLAQFQSDIWKTCNIVVNDDMTLNGDIKSYGNLYVNKGTLDLNGYKLEVVNAYHGDGNIVIDKGRMEIEKDYRIQNIEEDGTYGQCSGYIRMENAEDYVSVGGDFVTESTSYTGSFYCGGGNRLSAGTMEIKGGFEQKDGAYNFDATGTHKVIFSGEGTQTVSFENPSYSGFNDIETQNTDIEFATEVRGWTMQRDAEFKNGITKGMEGYLDLNGHTLDIKGDFVTGEGEVRINGGSLKITGDYRIQNVAADGTYGSCSGYIRMENAEDYVSVGGDFVTESTSYTGSFYCGGGNRLSAGTMEIKGGFEQKDGAYNFDATGTHKVIFSGEGTQTVSFESPSYSGFNDVDLKNANVKFATPVKGWKLKRNLTINSDIVGMTGTFDLNGNVLCINGDFVQDKGTVTLNRGLLNVEGTYKIESQIYDSTVEEYLPANSSGILNMTNASDRVVVKQNFVMHSSQKSNLTAGTLTIYGMFQQINGSTTNFNATGTHTTILAGKPVQKVSFESRSSQFNNLKILGDLENDYKFTPEKCWRTLYINTDVKEVQITPQNTKVKQGKTEEFKATVIGINKPDQSVKWSVMGAQSEATSITTGGVLSVGADENAEAVIVKAVSVQDTSKYRTVTVDIVKNTVPTNTPVATIEPGKTALPDNTVVPSAATLPDSTVVPKATALPDNTALPNETLFPEKTEIPDITAMPSMTVEPPKTEKPVPTATVEHTTIPDVTQIPVTSQMPVSTEKANVTKQSDKKVSSVGSSMKDSSGVIYKVISSGEVEYQVQGDTQVDKVVIPETVTLKGDKYKVTAITNNAFKNCTKLKSIVIGKNVTKIGTKAFYNCKNLTKITIPSSIVKIGKQAFANCNKLKRIIIKTDQLTPKTVGAKAFAKTFRRPVVKVPKDKKKDYKKLLRSKGLSSGAVFR